MKSLQYTPKGRIGFSCRLESAKGNLLVLESELTALEPTVSGDAVLLGNPALVTAVWAYGKNEAERRHRHNADLKEMHAKAAALHKKTAMDTAALMDDLTDETVTERWCSGCLTKSNHKRVNQRAESVKVATYICSNCGAATTPCIVPGCENFALRGSRKLNVPQYCAEHRHTIPSFEKLDTRLEEITGYEEWLKFEKHNAARTTRLIGATVGVGVVALPVALAAAPAIGGAIGAMTGLSGAAATSHGLALLGGGALAAGGLGMAGGTAVVTALGTALGGALGASITSAYTSSDKSFKIVQLRSGTGTPVLVANGFLTEKSDGWGGWRRIVDERYPEAPVYRVHWGARELTDLSAFIAAGGGAEAAKNVAAKLAKKATKLAELPGLGTLLFAAGIAQNPWMLAKTRAGMTGAILADIIARTDTEQFVLIGHSLGARVMATAAEALGSVDGSARIESMHLLGAAVSTKKDWRALDSAVESRVWNYFSGNDVVLSAIYRTAELGTTAVGACGFNSPLRKISDRDVSRKVASHSAYFHVVKLME